MNNNNRFSINELVYSRRHSRRDADAPQDRKSSYTYSDALTRIQTLISSRHGSELARIIDTDGAEGTLKTLIMRYINSENITVLGMENVSELVDRVFDEMAGVGIVSKYLKDPEVEEVNINSCDGIWVIRKSGKERIQYRFESAEACENVIRKMARLGNVIIDGSRPYGDSFLSRGVRMSGAIPPCTDEAIGGIASVRVQRANVITRENLIEWGTATADMLDFLCMCVNNGVSVAFAGPTGSGKTGGMGYLLSQIADDKRVVVIEDTYELKLARYDKDGYMTNDVVGMLTKDGVNGITMNDLLKLSLRLHPEVLVPAEMRGEEALTVQEAGRTGHTIVSSLHANSAQEAYDRILTMCLQSGTRLSEERLLRNIASAFPIMVFTYQLPDKNRVMMEVFEAIGVNGGRVAGNRIFSYRIYGHEYAPGGKVAKTYGAHAFEHGISPRLSEILFRNGVSQEDVMKFSSEWRN